jgi:hypothetical protein
MLQQGLSRDSSLHTKNSCIVWHCCLVMRHIAVCMAALVYQSCMQVPSIGHNALQWWACVSCCSAAMPGLLLLRWDGRCSLSAAKTAAMRMGSSVDPANSCSSSVPMNLHHGSNAWPAEHALEHQVDAWIQGVHVTAMQVWHLHWTAAHLSKCPSTSEICCLLNAREHPAFSNGRHASQCTRALSCMECPCVYCLHLRTGRRCSFLLAAFTKKAAYGLLRMAVLPADACAHACMQCCGQRCSTHADWAFELTLLKRCLH